jgi:hypothetical protein
MKVSVCSFFFSAKKKEPKKKLSAGALFYEPVCTGAGLVVPNKPMPI